jgi:hypothetical protein
MGIGCSAAYFEALPETTEAWIRIAMIQLMIRRLAAKKGPFQTGS